MGVRRPGLVRALQGQADVESVDAQVLGVPPQVALVSQLGMAHMRWMRKNTTLPPASGLPLFNCPASFQVSGSYQSASLAATLEK